MNAHALVPATARSAMGEHHGLRSETGYVRKANEDRMGFRRTADGEVYVVCDGMGGTKGGAKAAQLAVQALIERLNDPNGANDLRKRMQQAFAEANAAVFRHRNPDDPETRDMGSTAVAVLLRGTRLLIGHVGDSRAYRWSRTRGLKQLTRDHTRVQRLVDAKVITPTQAAVHPDASVLDRAMGHQLQVDAEVSDWVSLNRGERVLLCSDGLCGYASDAEIDAVMNSEDDPQRQADKLIELALKKGGEDNVTVQIVRVNDMNTSMLNRFLGSPLLLLAILTGTYLSMASWFHTEFAGLHDSNEKLRKQMDLLAQPAAASPSTDQKILHASVDELQRRMATLEQAKPGVAIAATPSADQKALHASVDELKRRIAALEQAKPSVPTGMMPPGTAKPSGTAEGKKKDPNPSRQESPSAKDKQPPLAQPNRQGQDLAKDQPKVDQGNPPKEPRNELTRTPANDPEKSLPGDAQKPPAKAPPKDPSASDPPKTEVQTFNNKGGNAASSDGAPEGAAQRMTSAQLPANET